MKGFQIGVVGDLISSAIRSTGTTDVFGKIAQIVGGRTFKSKKKEQWNQISNSRSSLRRNQIGSRDQFRRRLSQQSLRRSAPESERDAILSMNQEQLLRGIQSSLEGVHAGNAGRLRHIQG